MTELEIAVLRNHWRRTEIALTHGSKDDKQNMQLALLKEMQGHLHFLLFSAADADADVANSAKEALTTFREYMNEQLRGVLPTNSEQE